LQRPAFIGQKCCPKEKLNLRDLGLVSCNAAN